MMYQLKLYITGQTPRSRKLIQELKDRLNSNCGGKYTLLVVDIFDDPGAAYEDKVIATPTLVKTLPPPVRRIMGDLMDQERVMAALDIETIKGN
jgi:circadian clock protein KaiB